MGTLVPSMQKGDLHQADICGMFLLFFFFTPLKNMQAKKNTTGLVPLGIFFFLKLLCFISGLAICLLLFSPGQLPGLGCNGSGWFAPPPPQPSPLAGYCWEHPAALAPA